MRLLFQRQRDPADSHRRTKTVYIRHTVPHNDDAVFPGDDLPECLRLDSRFHPCIFLYLLAFSAVVCHVLRRLNHRLIAASAKRKIDGISRKLIILRIGKPIKPHTNTQRHRHLVADIDRLHILQHIKPVFFKLCHRFLPQNHQILVLLQLLRYSVQRGNILIHFSVNQCDQERTPYLLHALKRLVIVIKINKPHRKTLVINLPQRNLKCRLIKEIDGYQITVIVLRLYDIAVHHHLFQRYSPRLYMEIPALKVHIHLRKGFSAASRQPVLCHRRKQCGDGLLIAFLLMYQLFKLFIGPYYFSLIIKQRMRQIQIPEKPSLYLSVLRGKTDHLIHNHRLDMEIQQCIRYKINKNKCRQQHSRLYIKCEYSDINQQ